MLVLIIVSALSVSFILKPSQAENLENRALDNNKTSPTHDPVEQRRDLSARTDWHTSIDQKGSMRSDDPFNRWNFQNPSGWINSTYTNGDKVRLIIGVEEDFAELQSAIDGYGAKIVNSISTTDAVLALVIELPHVSISAFAEKARTLRSVRYLEPDMKVQASSIPNDPYWSMQWGPQKIKADWAWNTTQGNHSVLVAVVDTGIYYTHEDLLGNYQSGGFDWANNDSDPLDDNGHGTHCAGIIAATINNSLGTAGLAQVRVMAEKVLDYGGGGYYEWVANGIIDATNHGANIISMSLGGSGDSEVLHDAVRYAYNHGVLIVAAAGNAGSSDKSYPAAYDEVIAVAATDENDNTADFSNWGDWIELAAPGVNIYSTIPAGYASMSGTSMACPHISGVAALVWSRFANMSRDQLRMHLRYTADDLGSAGFDEHFGYGRINAKNAVEMVNPMHEVLVLGWTKPPYVEPNTTGIISARIFNYGRTDEANVTVELWANETRIDSTNITLLTSGATVVVNNTWHPTMLGRYNITVYVVPIKNETNVLNNRIQGFTWVGFAIKAFVLASGSGASAETWDTLNEKWQIFGDRLVYIDYTTLDRANLTYADISATGADVLIISCAFMREFSDSEIEAITRYVYEGHGLIVTAGTFYYQVPNNNKFAPLFGINETIVWRYSTTDLMELTNSSHPLFSKVPSPYVIGGYVGSALPSDGVWDSSEIVDGKYLALGQYNESAIVEKDGLLYISPWLEVVSSRYHHHLQLLYNAITWSRYQTPEHNLAVSLEAPNFLMPDENATMINVPVANRGLNNETDVSVHLFIDSEDVKNETVPTILTGSTYTMNYIWNVTALGTYNMTAYVEPVTGESRIVDNTVTKIVRKTNPLIHPEEGQWARYNQTSSSAYWNQSIMSTFIYSQYVSRYQINVTLMQHDSISGMNQTAWLLVNIMNRQVEKDSSGMGSFWFYGWIETNITVGSTINLLDSVAVVTGSRMIDVGSRSIDCWELSCYSGTGAVYTFWYEKKTGLWIGVQGHIDTYYSLLITLDATNVPLEGIVRHDLKVILEAPDTFWLGNFTLLRATVVNTGGYNETNVSLQLFINGTATNSTTIGMLQISSSFAVSCRWNPLDAGTFNITAYARPVINETSVANNIKTKIVQAKTFKGLVLFDGSHSSDPLMNYTTWIRSLENEGYIVDRLSSGYISETTLSKYNVLAIPQASYNYFESELYAIAQFVRGGKSLVVMGDASLSVCNSLTYFADITWLNYSGLSETTQDITPHMITNDVTAVHLDMPLAALSAHNRTINLVRDSFGKIMLLASFVGKGKVLCFADADSFQDVRILSASNLRLATNMIDWLVMDDKTPPFISITNPSDGITIANTSVLVQWMGHDNESMITCYSVYLNGNWLANTTANSYMVSAFMENTNNLTVVAYDVGGNAASDQISIIVDTLTPEASITSPANHSFVRGAIVIDFASVDTHLESTELLIDGMLIASYTTSGNYNYTWDTINVFDGSHTIMLRAIDQIGHTNSTLISVTVDNTAPSSRIIGPTDMAYLKGTCNISVTGYDVNLDRIELFINEDLKQTWSSSGVYTFAWNTALVPDGSYLVRLRVFDKSENLAVKMITVTVDNTMPQVALNAPIESEIKGMVVINFTAVDSNLASVLLYIDNAVLDVTGQSIYSWNSTHVGDGSHVIAVVVTDKAGNVGEAYKTVSTVNIKDTYVSQIDELNQRIAALELWITQLQYLIAGVLIVAAIIVGLVYVFLKRKPSTATKP